MEKSIFSIEYHGDIENLFLKVTLKTAFLPLMPTTNWVAVIWTIIWDILMPDLTGNLTIKAFAIGSWNENLKIKNFEKKIK